MYIRLRGGKRRFFLKSAYPLYQTEEAVSKFAFETASTLSFNNEVIFLNFEVQFFYDNIIFTFKLFFDEAKSLAQKAVRP